MISPPNHQKDALPSRQGWRHPRTSELLVSRPLSEEQIEEYINHMAMLKIKDEPEEVITEIVELPEFDDDDLTLHFMTRKHAGI